MCVSDWGMWFGDYDLTFDSTDGVVCVFVVVRFCGYTSLCVCDLMWACVCEYICICVCVRTFFRPLCVLACVCVCVGTLDVDVMYIFARVHCRW